MLSFHPEEPVRAIWLGSAELGLESGAGLQPAFLARGLQIRATLQQACGYAALA